MSTPLSPVHRKSSLSQELKPEIVADDERASSSSSAILEESSGSLTPAKTTFTLGSRSSQLALVQTHIVRDALQALYPAYSFPIVTMNTAGDINQSQALYLLGGKDLWTSELEAALTAGSVDLIVHSLKDIPTVLGPTFKLSGILERAEPRDALVMKRGLEETYKTLEDLPEGSVVGTSSVRRVAQLRRAFPQLKFMDVRGNLNTRLSKLDAPTSPYTALILAHAGLERINLGHRTTSLISPPQIHYAVGQGALGIETRADDEETEKLVRQIGHWPTEWRTKAERACLRKLEGGCSVPVGVNSTFAPSAEGSGGSHAGTLSLTGTVTSLDGAEHVVFSVTDRALASADDAEKVGLEVAEGLIAGGAGEILAVIAASKNAKGTVQGDEVLQQ